MADDTQVAQKVQRKTRRDRVLGAITTPLGFFALVLLVCEAVLVVLAAVVDPANQRLVLFGLFSFLAAIVALVAAMAIWRPESLSATRYIPRSDDMHCEVLADREELYRRAASLLGKARSVLDTTWGPDPPKSAAKHTGARRKYRGAQDRAIHRGTEYKELLSRTPGRADLIVRLATGAHECPNYDIRFLPAVEGLPTQIDFMVIDHQHLLLSHMDSDDPLSRHRYLYVRSPELGHLFAGLFARYWESADDTTHG